MEITRISLLTGEAHTRDMDVTPAQLAAWEAGTFIQDAAPHLPKEEREFILTGITPEEWRDTFGTGDEDPAPDAP